MDLFKWALRLWPLLPSEKMADALELAVSCRMLVRDSGSRRRYRSTSRTDYVQIISKSFPLDDLNLTWQIDRYVCSV